MSDLEVYPTQDIAEKNESFATFHIGKIGTRETVEIRPISLLKDDDGSIGITTEQLSNIVNELEPNGILWIRDNTNKDSQTDSKNMDMENGQMSFLDGRVMVNTDRREIAVDGDVFQPTSKEFDIILFLASNPGRVFDRDKIIWECWGHDWVGVRAVDVYISVIRKKLGNNRELIRTIRGRGYLFDDKFKIQEEN